MGKNKAQPYQLFVRDEFNKMKRNGEDVEFTSLFQKLSPKWASLPEERRNWYKERASQINNGHSNGGPPKPPQAQPTSQPPSQTTQAEPKPSTSDFSFRDTTNGIKMDDSPNVKPTNIMFDNIDVKPVIKEERGIKRELELDIHRTQQEQQQHEQPNKKKKNVQGFGIPNWRNIKNSNSPDADRYFDYNLLQLREQCESIVKTRADSILDVPLYTFSCNVLCKYKKDGTEVKYVPLEFGINAFSIRKGRTKDPYHVIIDSGPPPRNYWGDTHDHINSTHKIKVTQSGSYPAEARKDYRAIYRAMEKFVRDGERTILVADTYDLEQVKKSIEWIYEMASSEPPKKGKLDAPIKPLAPPSTWTILPLVDFVAAAYNWVHVQKLKYPLPKFSLHYYLKVRLETSVWDYELDLMCPYHRREENQSKWCARSCAIRVINALMLTFEEIYSNYTKAEEAREAKEDLNQQAPQPSTSSGAPQARTSAQQMQQPLNMPEEKEPPPLFEEILRRQEARRQEEEAFRRRTPPPGDYNYGGPPSSNANDNGLPLAIEAAAPPHPPNMLDPRIRRQANA